VFPVLETVELYRAYTPTPTSAATRPMLSRLNMIFLFTGVLLTERCFGSVLDLEPRVSPAAPT
jgi:hypothetical protein